MGGRAGQTLLPIGLGLGAGGLGALGGAGLAGMGPLAKWLGPAQAAAAGQAAATPTVQQTAGAGGGAGTMPTFSPEQLVGMGLPAAAAAMAPGGSDAALQQQAKDVTSGMANQLNTGSSRFGAGGQGAMPLPGEWDKNAKQFAQGYADQLTGQGPLPATPAASPAATTPGGGPDVGGLASNALGAVNALSGGGGGQQQPQAPAPPQRKPVTPAQGGGATGTWGQPTVTQVAQGRNLGRPHTQNIGPPVAPPPTGGGLFGLGPQAQQGASAGIYDMPTQQLMKLLSLVGGQFNPAAAIAGG